MNKRFSCCKDGGRENCPFVCFKRGSEASPVRRLCPAARSCERLYTNLLDEVLHFILKAPPLEFDSDQLVGTHVWAVFLAGQLLLQRQEEKV